MKFLLYYSICAIISFIIITILFSIDNRKTKKGITVLVFYIICEIAWPIMLPIVILDFIENRKKGKKQ